MFSLAVALSTKHARQALSFNCLYFPSQSHRMAGFPMSLKTPLRFGLPKGSLEQSTIELLARAGFKVQSSSRGYKPYINDPELDGRLVRPQEICRYVAQGFLDFGITGKDWIQESGHAVKVLCDLAYSKA